MFDVADHLDELRSRSTGVVGRASRATWWREVSAGCSSRSSTIVRVLDERGQIDLSVGRDGESARVVREKVETARALESLPAVAAAAHAGESECRTAGCGGEARRRGVGCGVGSPGAERDAGRSLPDGAGAVEADGGRRPGPPRGTASADVEGPRRGCCTAASRSPMCSARSSRRRSSSWSSRCARRRARRGSGGNAAPLTR